MDTEKQLEHLAKIRSLMEDSSRFISLSGLSGVFAGLFALIGAGAAYWYFDYQIYYPAYQHLLFEANGAIKLEFLQFLFLDGALVAGLALITGLIMTQRKAKKEGAKIWNHASKRLFINLFIPLATGGVFCLILLYHGEVYLVAPTTLIFYGLALLNGSKYTLEDIRYLGISEVILGLIASFLVGYGLLFWAIGFGVLHIIYGISMYFKYDE